MLTAKLEEKGLSKTDANEIYKYMNKLRLASIVVTGETEAPQILDFVLVLKNTGGYIIFTIINGVIIKDMFSESYIRSREVVGMDTWNFKKVYRIRMGDEDFSVSRMSVKELLSCVFNVIEPKSFSYVVFNNKTGAFTELRLNKDYFKGLSYAQYEKYLVSAYNNKEGLRARLEDLSFHIVSYEEEDDILDEVVD